MPINMQGSWTVSVKAKNADFPQRFIISGAASGNGTFAGNVGTPPVFVTGATWTITIQNNPGTGFINSADQIKFPTTSAGQYRFDIESNDAGGDADFNDLILTCSTPVTATDFLIYGNAKCYRGSCIINPCFRHWLVVESPNALLEALRYPPLKKAVDMLYPSIPIPPPRGPDPERLFTPLVIPLNEQTGLPPKRAQLLKLAEPLPLPKGAKTEGERQPTVVAQRSVAISSYSSAAIDYDRIALSNLADRFIRYCDTDMLAGFVLRFQEYDRTGAELAGGPYTGTGSREVLGLGVTDRNGNYIFRFSRSLAQFFEEADVDVAAGESEVVQASPDVIAQLMDSVAAGGVSYESAPYWNVPLLRRIDICIPCSRIGRPTSTCQGTRAIQALGKIRVGIPANTFDAAGRVTCTDTSFLDIPQTQCAAWGGVVRLSACFLDQPAVTQYTIRYRRLTSSGWSDWAFYQEPMPLFNTAILDVAQIGPFDRSLQVVAPGPLVDAKAYDNVENSPSWAASEWFLKAVINTADGSPAYAATPNSVEFHLQGYNAAGLQVADASDTITLFIDNNPAVYKIASVNMGTQTGGDCALFDLTGEPVPAKLTIRFKAVQNEGFLSTYGLSVRKGNIGGFPVMTTTGPLGEGSGSLGDSYAHTSALSCSSFFGTRVPDEPLADATDFVTAYVIPSPSGNWLGAEPFCTFAITVSGRRRVTDGNSTGWEDSPDLYLLGIQA